MSSSGCHAVAAPSLMNCSPMSSVAVGPVGKARNAHLDRARSSCSRARRYALRAHTLKAFRDKGFDAAFRQGTLYVRYQTITQLALINDGATA